MAGNIYHIFAIHTAALIAGGSVAYLYGEVMKKGDRLLKSALWYQKNGFSVIPVRKDKKPYVRWERYQSEIADPGQIRSWWKKWPYANVAIATGEVSNIDAVDVDSEKGRDALNEFLSDSIIMPISKTPKGYHYFFKHTPGLSNGVRVITDTDLRTSGGYIIVPPSKNGDGKTYEWMPDMSIAEVDPPAMPEMLFDVLQSGGIASADSSPQYKNGINPYIKKSFIGERNIPQTQQPQQTATNRNITFNKGGRDDTLFNLANHLVKSGMSEANVRSYLEFFGQNCNPPFPEKEIQAKIDSALKRAKNRNRNLTADIREAVTATWGNITATNVVETATNATFEDRKKIRVILGRLVKEGILERVPGQNGVYRKVDTDIEEMDFKGAEVETVDLWLPFGIHHMVEIMPGNIIIIAGEPNAGKTGFVLNVVRENMRKFKVHYFNSEMGSSELKKRLDLFDDIALSDWNFKSWERSDNFADVIKPGKGNINVIDFLEIYDNFYEVAGRIAEIHKKLNGAIAIIALQKNPNVDTGLGGFRGLEKPRLYLAMSPGVLKIVKAKNWKGPDNPNYKQTSFNIVSGCKFFQKGGWHRPPPKT